MTLLSHIYRSLSSTVKTPAHAYLSSSSPAASSLALAQRQFGMPSVKEYVDGKIADNKIVVFSKTYCPFCTRTKQYFATKYPQETVEVVELDTQEDDEFASGIQDYLKQMTGARSVPRTFISGEPVGGNDDLHAKSKTEIDALIAKRS